MKHTPTKRALLLSVLSLLLCCAMLVGSTFAWFTDSVTSGKNKIVAGNLDVELEYSLDGTTWTAVDETTNMFKEGALWEPGYTEVVYLRVINAGSLALKYQLGINVANKVIGKTEDDKDIDLSNFIEFGVVEAATAFADRAAARDAVKDSAVLLSDGYSSGEGKLPKGETSEMLALVVYMPETVGNDANHGTGKTQPEIYMGINLIATQNTVEEDSFDNTYDKDAKYPGIVAINNAIYQGALDSNAKIEDMLGKGKIYFDNTLRTDPDGAKAITLHFSDGVINDNSAISAAVYAVIGLIDIAVDKEAANIKSVEIGHGRFADDSNVMPIEGQTVGVMANGGAPEDSWVTERLLKMVDTYGDLTAAFTAATTEGFNVEIADMAGNSQIYRMYFDIAGI